MVDFCKNISSSSRVLKVCCVLWCLTLVIQCVGIGTTYWKYELISERREYGRIEFHRGLFEGCGCIISGSHQRCICSSHTGFGTGWSQEDKDWSQGEQAWSHGIQALEIIGVIAICCVGFMIALQLFYTQRVCVKTWGIVTMSFAGICILAGVILFGVKVRSNLNFSFGLCVVSAFMCFVCSFLLFIDRHTFIAGPRTNDPVQCANGGGVTSSLNQMSSRDHTAMHYVHPPPYPVADAKQQRQAAPSQGRI